MTGKANADRAQAPSDVRRNGRPPYQPEARTGRQVEAMVGYGIPIAAIARVVGVSENTLRKYYDEELAVGQTKANAKVIESLIRKATGDGQGAVAAAIFWAKTRCGWKETLVNELTGPGGGAIRAEMIQRDADEFTRRLVGIAAHSAEYRITASHEEMTTVHAAEDEGQLVTQVSVEPARRAALAIGPEGAADD